MLGKKMAVVAFTGVAALASAQTPLTVDELIAKNITARGGMEKLKAVETVRMTGKMTVGPGMEAPVVMELKRPDRLRMEFTVQGMTGIQAYDGKQGWMVMPFMGKKDPEAMSADDSKDAAEQADIDGPLVDYQAKGHTVELLGKEKVEGTDAYKLKITLKNGDIRYVFLDAEYFLEIRGEGKRKIRGSEVDFEATISDYKEVGGLMVPHSFDSGAKGSPQRQKLAIEKVEINVPVDDGRFTMPAASKN